MFAALSVEDDSGDELVPSTDELDTAVVCMSPKKTHEKKSWADQDAGDAGDGYATVVNKKLEKYKAKHQPYSHCYTEHEARKLQHQYHIDGLAYCLLSTEVEQWLEDGYRFVGAFKTIDSKRHRGYDPMFDTVQEMTSGFVRACTLNKYGDTAYFVSFE